MQDVILTQQPNWRYCRIAAGEKKPYPANWQNTPLTLDQVDSASIGIILGPFSGGLLAIDFDGPSAWTWYDENIGIALPETVCWSSGKVGRCQMVFTVPEPFWDWLHTKKFNTGVKDAVTGKFEGLEFRWGGVQSVLPPSLHPDTKQPYFWITDATNPVAELPNEVIAWWLNKANPEIHKEPDTTPEVTLDDLTNDDIKEVEDVLSKLRAVFPMLEYDLWRTVTWAVLHALGRDAGMIVMQKYYPAKESGEYKKLTTGWNKAKSPSIGTLVHLLKTHNVEVQTKRKQEYLNKLSDLEELAKIIKELKNGRK
jgi:hypothetical protein